MYHTEIILKMWLPAKSTGSSGGVPPSSPVSAAGWMACVPAPPEEYSLEPGIYQPYSEYDVLVEAEEKCFPSVQKSL